MDNNFMFNCRNIFNKKVALDESKIVIGSRKVRWEEIAGAREFSDKLLEKIHYQIPFIELFLFNGKIIKISNLFNFTIRGKNTSYNDAISYMRSKALNINKEISNWFEWRLILPVILVQIPAISFGFILKNSFEHAVTFALTASIISVPIGFYWERKSRAKKIKEYFDIIQNQTTE